MYKYVTFQSNGRKRSPRRGVMRFLVDLKGEEGQPLRNHLGRGFRKKGGVETMTRKRQDMAKKCDFFVQQLYILNLSITEITFNLLWMMVHVMKHLPQRPILLQVQHYTTVVIYAQVAFVFYATMFFIVLDRLVACWQPIRYMC